MLLSNIILFETVYTMLGEVVGPPMKNHSWPSHVKILSWSAFLAVLKLQLFEFVSFTLKSYGWFWLPKFTTSLRSEKGISLQGMTRLCRFWCRSDEPCSKTRRVRSAPKTAQTRHSVQGYAYLRSQRCSKFWESKPCILSVNDTYSNSCNFNTAKNADHDEIFTWHGHECVFVGGPTTFPNKSRWRTAAILNFVKMLC